MPVLHLLRHAKSSWEDPELADRERPLDPRGERAAVLMGVYLAQCGVRPQRALCSSAQRAIQTLERALAQIPEAPGLSTESALYEADAEALLERLRRVPPGVSALLLVGHNPALHDLARALVGTGERDARRRLERKLPTAAWAELELPDAAGWGGLAPGAARLRRFVAPKDLV